MKIAYWGSSCSQCRNSNLHFIPINCWGFDLMPITHCKREMVHAIWCHLVSLNRSNDSFKMNEQLSCLVMADRAALGTNDDSIFGNPISCHFCRPFYWTNDWLINLQISLIIICVVHIILQSPLLVSYCTWCMLAINTTKIPTSATTSLWIHTKLCVIVSILTFGQVER